MSYIKTNEHNLSLLSLSGKLCVFFVWISVLYSSIIQYAFFRINNGMLILGVLVLAAFVISFVGKPFDFKMVFTSESIWMLAFMIYMLPIGFVVSPDISGHTSQWVSSFEYLFLLIVISSLIMCSGTDTFHILILISAIILVVVFIRNPVQIAAGNRYSISKEVNPNGLGMSFSAGVWVLLYFQQKRKIPLLIALGISVLLGYGIFLTGSRKALIAAGVIAILWFFFCFIPSIKNGKSRWRSCMLFFSLLSFFVLIIAFFRIYSDSDIATRMGELSEETITGSRISMYKYGLSLFLKQPIFGLGFQGFKHYYGYYSHATIIEVPVSSGIFGSILYFTSYIISIKKCISVFSYCRGKNEYSSDLVEIKMLIVLWVAMLFYCTCVIHPYQYDSYILFGVIFGSSSSLEKKIRFSTTQQKAIQGSICRWIK